MVEQHACSLSDDVITDLQPSWQTVLRLGIFPQFTDVHLLVLRTALETDDPRLLQGATTVPPPLQCVRDWPCEAACILGFCGWQGGDLKTVSEVEEAFGQMCFEGDRLLGEPAAVRHLLNWFDSAPRDEMRGRDRLLPPLP